MKYVKRLLGLPFYLALLVIGCVWFIVIKGYFWMKFGGEVVNYDPKMNRKTLTDLVNAVNSK